jgi:hypothetical protein
MTTTPERGIDSGPVVLWYRDVISCLQSTFASQIVAAGADPLEVLGAHWEFLFIPGDVRAEEFYFPCRYEGDVGRSLAPHHPVRSRWVRPADPADPLAEIRAAVRAGRMPIAAVDNFHLPFRPAFGDVHAAHLLVVCGVDEDGGMIEVSDAMPPAFQGPIAITDFLNAWSSVNPRDAQDAFFSDSGIERRLLDVSVGPDFPVLDASLLRRILRTNVELFETGQDDRNWRGRAGLRRFTEDLVGRAEAGDARALEEAYPFGWGMQAQAGLHGELLRVWGSRHGVPEVCEAGRLAESVAHAWTGVRITSAHGRGNPVAAVGDLARHARRLRNVYEAAMAAEHQAEEAL